MSKIPDPFDPEQFSALWSRVAPEGSACPVTPNAAPPRPAETDPAFLSGCIRLELCRWKQFQSLTRQGVPGRESAAGAYARAKRLSAALFLRTGGRYFPARALSCPLKGNAAARLRTLYAGSCRMEQRYREAAAGNRDSRLRALYAALADGHSREQEAICALLEGL